jgi:hypothetical protein
MSICDLPCFASHRFTHGCSILTYKALYGICVGFISPVVKTSYKYYTFTHNSFLRKILPI